MIRDSVTVVRGCAGGCSFCALGLHQGKLLTSRSEDSVLAELRRLAAAPGFRGTVTDLGGPYREPLRVRERGGGGVPQLPPAQLPLPGPVPALPGARGTGVEPAAAGARGARREARLRAVGHPHGRRAAHAGVPAGAGAPPRLRAPQGGAGAPGPGGAAAHAQAGGGLRALPRGLPQGTPRPARSSTSCPTSSPASRAARRSRWARSRRTCAFTKRQAIGHRPGAIGHRPEQADG